MNMYIVAGLLIICAIVLLISHNKSEKEFEYCTSYKTPEKDTNVKSRNKSEIFDIVTTVDGIDNQALRIYLPIYIKAQKLDKLSKEQKDRIKKCDNILEFLKIIVTGETRAILASYYCDEMVSDLSVERKYKEEIRKNVTTEFNKVGYDTCRIDFGKLEDDANYLNRR